MQSQFEVYVLCKSRTLSLALSFLEDFLPNRAEVADQYPVPELSDEPELIATNAIDLIRILEEKKSETYGIYWNRDGDGEPMQAMLFFTEDGGMIAGLAAATMSPGELLQTLSRRVRSDYGMVVLEERPPDRADEFCVMCQNSTEERIVGGVFLPRQSEPE